MRLGGGKFIGPVQYGRPAGPCLPPSPRMPVAGRRALSIRLKAFRQPRRAIARDLQ
jgi:hypothetical protein